MTKTLKLNTALFFALLLISGFAVYHQLGDFAHLKNADGVLTDMRSMVLWDIRFPRLGLALSRRSNWCAFKLFNRVFYC